MDPYLNDVKFPPLRQFQVDAHLQLQQGFREGHKNQLVMASTGAGKTMLAMWVIYHALKKGKTAVFVCDRTNLINQTSEVADGLGLKEHAIVQAKHKRRDVTKPFQIASIQTIAKRGYWPQADLIVIDECHATYSAWTEYVGQTKAVVLGISATPFTAGLGKHFSRLICPTTMDELTRNGVLVPMRVLSCTRPDMTGAKTSGGEWTDAAAAERGMAIIGDVVTEWIRHANNRKTIVFGSTIRHCQELAQQFINCGVMAAVFTAETTPAERKVLLDEYRKPDSGLRVLISVEALAKGFDVPDVECVVDCRPLRKSLSTAIQMWGRGLRSVKDGSKKDCLLLDHSGNIIRFAKDFADIYFDGLQSLDMGEKLDKEVRKDEEELQKRGCPQCGFKPFHRMCMACGYEKQPPALVPHEAGSMEEVEVFVGKKKLADNYVHLWNQLSSYAKIYSDPGKQHARAWHLFRNITGFPPPSDWNVARAPEVPITKEVRNKITNLNMRWKKGMQKRGAYGL